jgi:hypothetical protein
VFLRNKLIEAVSEAMTKSDVLGFSQSVRPEGGPAPFDWRSHKSTMALF